MFPFSKGSIGKCDPADFFLHKSPQTGLGFLKSISVPQYLKLLSGFFPAERAGSFVTHYLSTFFFLVHVCCVRVLPSLNSRGNRSGRAKGDLFFICFFVTYEGVRLMAHFSCALAQTHCFFLSWLFSLAVSHDFFPPQI